MRKLFLTLSFAVFSLWLFGQNENPYSQFGYDAPIMPEKNTQLVDFYTFYVYNPDTTAFIAKFSIDFKTSLITFYSKSNEVVGHDSLLCYSIARWLTTDPAGQFHSPYLGMGNNPINRYDPNGAWSPDADGNLIAESGDDILSLYDYFGGAKSWEDVSGIFYSMDAGANGITASNLAGNTVVLDNVFTRSIANSTSNLTTDVFLAYQRTGVLTAQPTPEDYYNCWGSAIAGSSGREIVQGVGIQQGQTFDNILLANYNNTNDPVFGQTVLRFANQDGVQHGAVYYGSSRDGTVYVYTKNGWYIKPEIMKLNNLLHKIPSYGTVQGINPGHTGFYNH